MTTHQKSSSILLVDDDRLILSTLADDLARAGYLINAAESVDEAEAWLDSNPKPDLVILDVRMPNRNGLELTKKLKELDQIPFILLTAYSEQELVEQAAESGAVGYLVKPVEVVQLLPAVETALANAASLMSLRGERQHLQTALDSDRAISIATGIIMEQHKLNQHDAIVLLRKNARSQHIKLHEIAAKLINAREELNLRIFN